MAEEITPKQKAASFAMHQIAQATMPLLEKQCGQASEGLDECVVFPILSLVTVEGSTVIGSTVFYDQRVSADGVARLQRMTAANLEGRINGVVIERGEL